MIQVLLTIETEKDVPDLLDKIACRAYTLDGVKDVTAELVEVNKLPVLSLMEMRDE